MLQEARHNIDLLFAEITRRAPVGHTARATVVDQHLEKLGTTLLRDIGSQWLAGSALAQDTVTTGAALKIKFGGNIVFSLCHVRGTRRHYAF